MRDTMEIVENGRRQRNAGVFLLVTGLAGRSLWASTLVSTSSGTSVTGRQFEPVAEARGALDWYFYLEDTAGSGAVESVAREISRERMEDVEAFSVIAEFATGLARKMQDVPREISDAISEEFESLI